MSRVTTVTWLRIGRPRKRASIPFRCKATATMEPETTQHKSGPTPDQEVEIKNIAVYVSGYTETDTTGMLSPLTVGRQRSEFVSSRQSDQILAAVRLGFECRCNGQNGCWFNPQVTNVIYIWSTYS